MEQQNPSRISRANTRGRATYRAETRRERERARRASMTPEQVASRRARARERYANERPEQRLARQVRRYPRAAARCTTHVPNFSVVTISMALMMPLWWAQTTLSLVTSYTRTYLKALIC